MIRLAADENFNNAIVWGLLRRNPAVDVVRVQDVGLRGAKDPAVLEWAAQEDRILLTHDENTMIGYAYDRVVSGRPMAGVFHVRRETPLGRVIEDLLTLVECSRDGEWSGHVRFLPL